jgi:hypothetical protein
MTEETMTLTTKGAQLFLASADPAASGRFRSSVTETSRLRGTIKPSVPAAAGVQSRKLPDLFH